MATSPMDVDSGCGSCTQEEFLPPIEVAGSKESKALASGPSFGSQDMVVGPFAKFRNAITIIEQIQKLISESDMLWNKQQCKRIADRCSFLAELMAGMVQDENSVVNQASDGGSSSSEEVNGLLHVLLKVKIFISGYVDKSQAITNVICRTNNPEAFKELHEELDDAMAKLGLQGMEDATQLTSGVESKMNMLRADAEEDKEEMLKMLSQMSESARTTEMNQDLKKLAHQVVLDKTTDLDVKKLVKDSRDKLPSYLKIAQTEIELGEPVRQYERKSERDLLHEVGWAEVRKGKFLDCDFAIKVFNCGADDGSRATWNQEQLLIEAGSLVELQHPHVVRLVGFGQDKKQSVFVMELMDGDLRNFMTTKLKATPKPAKPFTDSEALKIIMQIAQAMYFIHTRGYAHGDLKCSNIVVKKNRGQYLEVKIADLRGSQKRGEWNPEAFEKASKTRRPRWTAPEALDHYGRDREPSWEDLKRIDIYSFGMTCYEIVTGNFPFHGIRDEGVLLEMIKKGERPKLPETLADHFKGLIASCWEEDPKKRPSFEKICQFLDNVPSPQKDRFSNFAVMLSQFTDKMPRWVLGLGKEQSESSRGISDSADILRPEDMRNIPEYQYLKIEPEALKRVTADPIGSGSSAKVYKITWLGCTFAEKELRKSKSYAKFVQQEIESLIRISHHPFMVQLVGLSVKPNGVCSIIMEYMDGNLRKLIDTRLKKRKGAYGTNREGPFDLHEAVQIISKFALGMAYLHSRNLVHGDLKSENVLAQEYSGIIDVKIVDFGMSHLEEFLESSDTESIFTESSDTELSVAESSDTYEASKTEFYYRGWGTGFYRAPEMLRIDQEGPKEELSKLGLPDEDSTADLQAKKATDVFSFAMTCYEVLTGNRPFSDRRPKPCEVRSGLRPKWTLNPNPDPKWLQLQAIVERCWCTIPKERLTFNDICKELLSFQTSS
ncbi:hypothetical protein M758_4G018000 [Ceratodon purpureus]|nr:hypothetical protein M758_4G018000 [Ceratodon purpureus]